MKASLLVASRRLQRLTAEWHRIHAALDCLIGKKTPQANEAREKLYAQLDALHLKRKPLLDLLEGQKTHASHMGR